jgi:serine/threonine protein kinase
MGPARCDSTMEFRTIGRHPLDDDDEEAFLSDDDDDDVGLGDITLAPKESNDLHVFEEGDRLSVGEYHDGSLVVDSFPHSPVQDSDAPRRLEVVRQLGSGSYAMVYLARAIVSPSAADDDYDLDDDRPVEYGKEYALKCLCKKNLSDDLLEVQRYEVRSSCLSTC